MLLKIISFAGKRALCSVGFLGRLGLFKEMNNSFLAIVRYEIRSFFETHRAQSAAGIHIPLCTGKFSGCWLSLSAITENEFRVSAKKTAFDVRLADLSSALARAGQLRNPPAV